MVRLKTVNLTASQAMEILDHIPISSTYLGDDYTIDEYYEAKRMAIEAIRELAALRELKASPCTESFDEPKIIKTNNIPKYDEIDCNLVNEQSKIVETQDKIIKNQLMILEAQQRLLDNKDEIIQKLKVMCREELR